MGPMTTRALLRPAALLAAGLILSGALAACGSSGSTTAGDPSEPATSSAPSAVDSSPAPSSPSSPSSPASADSSTPASAATGSPVADGAAPASVSIDSPASGSQASGTLVVSGTANSPEANVPWEVDSMIEGVVASGHATAEGWMDKAYPWTTKVDLSQLQPGSYTFTARVDDDSDDEGTKPPEATITFVIPDAS
jgi:hypothetical protein